MFQLWRKLDWADKIGLSLLVLVCFFGLWVIGFKVREFNQPPPKMDPRIFPKGIAIVTVRSLEHAGAITKDQADKAVDELLHSPPVPPELQTK